MNEFVVGKLEAVAGDRHRLLGEALQIQLHSARFGIIERDMRETFDIEIAVQLAIYPDQQVEIERRVDAGPVVVGGLENLRLLLQIGADQHFAPASEQVGAMAKKT